MENKLLSFCTAKERIKKKRQKEKKTYKLENIICKQCNRPGLNFQNIQTAHTTQKQKPKQSNQKNKQKT